MAEYDIAVIGGDKRTAYMVPFFRESGYKVICFGIQETEEAEMEAKHSMEAKHPKEAKHPRKKRPANGYARCVVMYMRERMLRRSVPSAVFPLPSSKSRRLTRCPGPASMKLA